jgi:hypothetical protein
MNHGCTALLQKLDEHDNIAQSPVVCAVRAYGEDVLHDRVQCSLRRCPRCGCKRKEKFFFRRHAIRYRFLFIVVGRMIYRIKVSLIRWKCPACECTFTDYPSFAIPHKRYSFSQMRERARQYILDNRVSYRKGVATSALPLFHANGNIACAGMSEQEKQSEEIHTMAHSTLYHWVTTLGCSKYNSQDASCPTGYKNHNPEQPREPVAFVISPRKYRKRARKRVLEACRNL